MSRKDRRTLIALGMSVAVRDLPTKLSGGLRDEELDGIELPGFFSWYERRRRKEKEYRPVAWADAARQTRD